MKVSILFISFIFSLNVLAVEFEVKNIEKEEIKEKIWKKISSLRKGRCTRDLKIPICFNKEKEEYFIEIKLKNRKNKKIKLEKEKAININFGKKEVSLSKPKNNRVMIYYH